MNTILIIIIYLREIKNERKIKLDAFTLCIICLSQKDIKF